ncbi:MAG TPA: DUF2127 domain-containing protein [Candidatus Angelobacter sp.]
MDDRKSFLVRHLGLRGIAIFEAAKGVLALLLGVVLLSMRHKDMESVAGHILGFLHVNPDRRFYHEVLQAAGRVTTHGIWLFVFGIVAYALIRFAEAVGLWLERVWAEWFAIISGSMYLPWEIYELVWRQTWIRWAVLIINLLIVIYLVWLRIEMHKSRQQKSGGTPPVAVPEPNS